MCVLCLPGWSLLEGASRHLVAIKTKLTVTGTGRDQHGATILIENGRILAIGKGLKIPWNADVIDASDQIVMPGMVLAHTSDGLERENESMPDVPFLSTYDAIDPFQPFFRTSLRNGITSMLVLPGNRTRFGGMGTVVKPVGETVDMMLISKPVGLKISLAPTGGQGRMGHMQKLREYLQDNKKFFEDLAKKKKKAQAEKKKLDTELTPAQKVMEKLFTGKITAFVYCPEASDVIRAIELIQEYKFKAALVIGKKAWKAAPHIKRAGLPVILPPDIVFYEKDPETGELSLRNLPVMFQKLRIPFTFQIDPGSYDSRYLWQVAAEAVKYGLSKDSALVSVTSTAASLIGLGGERGQIAPGKQADLLFLTGDVLDPTTWIDKVMIDGKIVYDRSKDTYLQNLLKGEKK